MSDTPPDARPAAPAAPAAAAAAAAATQVFLDHRELLFSIVYPEFPRDPRRVHWSIPEPATAGDTDQASSPAFQRTAADINTRIRHLLPVLAATHHKEV